MNHSLMCRQITACCAENQRLMNKEYLLKSFQYSKRREHCQPIVLTLVMLLAALAAAVVGFYIYKPFLLAKNTYKINNTTKIILAFV